MPATEPNDFFKKGRSFAEIKQELLGKYFDSWCNIRLAPSKTEAAEALLFIDLHAGDEQEIEKNPVLAIGAKVNLLKSILKKPRLNETMRTFFFDKRKAVLEHVCEGMEALAYHQELIHPPVPLSNPDNKAMMGDLLAGGCPSLIFLDPFSSGYAQQMLLQAVNVWHSDLFMLLNPENLLKGVAGGKVSKPLVDLFGVQLQKIKNYCRKEKEIYRRQEFILSHLISLLQEKGHFTLLFKVNLPDREQPYHYLLFSSPDGHAYRSFKETIQPYSTSQEDGIPAFFANDFLQPQFSLFEQRPVYTIPNLIKRITDQASLYKYKSIEKIYELDSGGTHYIRENYIAAIEQLLKEGKIELLNAKTMQTIRLPTPASVVKFRV